MKQSEATKSTTEWKWATGCCQNASVLRLPKSQARAWNQRTKHRILLAMTKNKREMNSSVGTLSMEPKLKAWRSLGRHLSENQESAPRPNTGGRTWCGQWKIPAARDRKSGGKIKDWRQTKMSRGDNFLDVGDANKWGWAHGLLGSELKEERIPGEGKSIDDHRPNLTGGGKSFKREN
jgi:DNA-binding protein H-NS